MSRVSIRTISNLLLWVLLGLPLWGCSQDLGKLSRRTGIRLPGSNTTLSQDEVARGLREALNIGAGNASGRLGLADGYLRNQLVRIILPPEARNAEAFVRRNGGKLGNDLVDDVITKMNRAAEQAAANPRTREIFTNAITGLTIQDAWGILRGDSTAATRYLQGRTETQLTDLFAPIIGQEMNRVGLQNTWSQFSNTYNRLSTFTRRDPLPTDISRYVTQRALQGLFVEVAREEARIRANPAARVTDLLRRVFGSASK